jgi:hypothetical protein
MFPTSTTPVNARDVQPGISVLGFSAVVEGREAGHGKPRRGAQAQRMSTPPDGLSKCCSGPQNRSCTDAGERPAVLHDVNGVFDSRASAVKRTCGGRTPRNCAARRQHPYGNASELSPRCVVRDLAQVETWPGSPRPANRMPPFAGGDADEFGRLDVSPCSVGAAQGCRAACRSPPAT